MKIFLFCFTSLALFQTRGQDSYNPSLEKLVLGFHWDYVKSGLSFFQEGAEWEVGSEILLLGRYQLAAEFGNTSRTFSQAYRNGNSSIRGPYVRLGADYQIMSGIKNTVALGMRYGRSSFDESVSYTIKTDNSTTADIDGIIERESLRGSWVEVVLHSRRFVGLKKRHLTAERIVYFRWGFYFAIRGYFPIPAQQMVRFIPFPDTGSP